MRLKDYAVGQTIIIDSKKKLAAYLREQASLSIRRECKIDKLSELLTDALPYADRLPSWWKGNVLRALKMKV